MNEALWALLDDEELSEQIDQWARQCERDFRARRYGRAAWCNRMSNDAWTFYNARRAARAEQLRQGDQLAIPLPESAKRPQGAA
jgi:hypothetical protein